MEIIVRHITLLFGICLITAPVLFAQSEQERSEFAGDPQDTVKFAKVSIQKPKFSPFLAPSYSPETELMILGGGLITFKLRPLDPVVQRSSIPFSLGYSTNKTLLFNARPTIFGNGEKWRLSGDIWIKNIHDHYFGVGYENGRNRPEGDSTTAYQRDWWKFKFDWLFKIKNAFYLGPILDINQTKASDVSPGMENDPDFQAFGPKNRNTGVGIAFSHDTRDVTVNPYEGHYASLSAVFYWPILGGDNTYQVYDLDYRKYFTIKRAGSTLAVQGKMRYGVGDVPYAELSMMGSPWDLRGYRWGRFRDKLMLFGVAEYRYMFKRKTPRKKDGSMLSRIGLVTWTGVGSIAPDFSELKNWLPNVGVGVRYEVQPRMNVRADFGWGVDSFGAYISFNEAF